MHLVDPEYGGLLPEDRRGLCVQSIQEMVTCSLEKETDTHPADPKDVVVFDCDGASSLPSLVVEQDCG